MVRPPLKAEEALFQLRELSQKERSASPKKLVLEKTLLVDTGKSVVYQSHLNGGPFQKLITAFQGV